VTIEQEPLVAGLHTAHHPGAAVPLGALATADNCVIRRAGMVEPDPGFKDFQEAGVDAGNRVVRMWDRVGGTDQLIANVDTGSDFKLFESDNGTDPFVEVDITAGSVDGDGFEVVDVFRATKNDHYVTNRGVYRHSMDEAPVYAGVPEPIAYGLFDVAGSLVPDLYFVAYRITWTHVDAQGILHESVPSNYMVFENLSGSAKGISVEFFIPPGIGSLTDHRYRIYRTAVSSVSPGDRMYIVEEREPTIDQYTAGSVSYVDDGTITTLGVPLYTNDTSEGAGQASAVPPYCDAGVYFNGMAIYAGNARQPYRVDLELYRNGSGEDGLGGARVKPGFTWLFGASVLTGTISSADGLAVGQYLQGSLGGIPDNSRIVSFVYGSPGTITMDTVTTNSFGGSVTIMDHITVGGVSYRIGASDDFGTTYPAPMAVWRSGKEAMARAIVQMINVHMQTNPSPASRAKAIFTGTMTRLAVGTDATFALIRDQYAHPDVESFDVTFSAGFGYDADPSEARYPFVAPGNTSEAQGGSITSAILGGKAHIWVSKVGQPEAVPVLNLQVVGDESTAILRLQAIRESLFVFKEDGIYRITGNSFGSLRLDEFDLTTRLVDRRTVVSLGNRIFALCDSGVVTITDGGVTDDPPVSWPIDDRISAAILTARTFPELPCFAYANEKESEYSLWIPNAESGASGEAYVWNDMTRAWVHKAAFSTLSGFHSDRFRKTYWGHSGSSSVFVGREPHPTVTGYLNSGPEYDIVTVSVTLNDEYEAGKFADRVTFTTATAPVPEVGDIIAQGVIKGVVVAVTGPGDCWVDDGSGIAFPADALLVEAIETVIEPRVKTQGALPALKTFQEVQTAFDDVEGIQRMSMSFQAEKQAVATTNVRTLERSTDPVRRELRWFVPRQHSLSVFLKPTLTIKQANASWRLWGFNVVAEPLSEVVERG
jgi:hypothetical protein